MSDEDAREIERGFLSAVLEGTARNLSFEEAVILIDRRRIIDCLKTLQSEGWDELETIYSSAPDDDTVALLTYRLRSKQRLHRTVGVQVAADPENMCRSVAGLFANARSCEEALSREYGIIFVQ